MIFSWEDCTADRKVVWGDIVIKRVALQINISSKTPYWSEKHYVTFRIWFHHLKLNVLAKVALFVRHIEYIRRKTGKELYWPLLWFFVGDQVSRRSRLSHNEIGGTRRMSVLTYVVLICFAIFGIQYWLKNKSYIFQAKDIEKIARHHVGKGK